MRAIVGVSGGVEGSKEGLSTKEICPSHGPSNFSSSVLHMLSLSRPDCGYEAHAHKIRKKALSKERRLSLRKRARSPRTTRPGRVYPRIVGPLFASEAL